MQTLKLRFIYTLGMLAPLAWAARAIERLDADTAEALRTLLS
jgi:hypothetical protein